jgi:hypothetical protein
MSSIIDSLIKSIGGRSGRKGRLEEMEQLLRQRQQREQELLKEVDERQRALRQMEEQLRHCRQLEQQVRQTGIPILHKAVEWDIVCNTCSDSISKNKQQQMILWHGAGEAIYYRKHDEATISDAQTGAGPASSLPLDVAVQHSGHQIEFHWREVGDWEKSSSTGTTTTTTTTTTTIAATDDTSSTEETKKGRRRPEDTATTV